MSVYLGSSGCVHIRRQGEPYGCKLQADDVDVDLRRFSIDFDPDEANPRPTPLITGDEVEFKAKVATNDLKLVSGVTDNDVTRFVHVDQTGGIRLYTNYRDAVNGGKNNAVELVAPSADQDIVVDVVNIRYEQIAQMRSWEITTNRETVDTSILGEEFRQYYDQGMVSGQGAINAIWDYKLTPCVDSFDDEAELANYFSQLVIRFREGSKFKGLFIVYRDEQEAVWYEAECICSSVGMSFSPGEVINTQIQFVTTGQIWLKQGQPPSYLLLDGVTNAGDEILLETGPGSIELEFSE